MLSKSSLLLPCVAGGTHKILPQRTLSGQQREQQRSTTMPTTVSQYSQQSIYNTHYVVPLTTDL